MRWWLSLKRQERESVRRRSKRGRPQIQNQTQTSRSGARAAPGEHHLCVKGQLPLWKGLSLHQLNAKSGETYYFFVRVVAGGGYNELTLTQLDPDQGKELVARSRFISSP